MLTLSNLTKKYRTTSVETTALDAIEPHLHASSAVVSLQNGVNEPHIAKRIGAERTIGCLVDFSADYHEPGLIARGRSFAEDLLLVDLDGRVHPEVELPPIEELTLPNGLQVFVIKSERLPVVSVQLAVRAGVDAGTLVLAADPP